MILHGDALSTLMALGDDYIQTCVTSPPYWGLRDYGSPGQLGLEPTPDEYVANMVSVFREVRRVLKDDGTLWLNLGDSYAANYRWGGASNKKSKQWSNEGSRDFQKNEKPKHPTKPKDLVGIPWRVAFALQADGWYLRQDIIWHKPNPMPESVRDRCTKAHEYMFLLTKSPKYYFDHVAIKEPLAPASAARYAHGFKDKRTGSTKGLRVSGECQPRGADVPTRDLTAPDGRNKRSVWTVTTKPFKGAHFATFPPDLIEPCILAGSAFGDYVLDPFAGAGTTGLVAKKHGRKFVGIELNSDYVTIAEKRISGDK